MIKRLLKKNTSWSAVGEMWLKGIMLLTTIIIARSLGDSLFGVFTFIMALLQLFQVLIDFGLPLIVVKELNQTDTDEEKYLSNILSLKILLSLFSLTILSVLGFFLHKPPIVVYLIYIQSIFIILQSFNDLLLSIFRAKEKFKYEAFIKFANGLIIISLIALVAPRHSLRLFVYTFVLTAAISLIITIILISKKYFTLKFSFQTKIIKNIIKKSWPLALAGLFTIVYFRIDAIMLSYLKGDEATGWYNAAYQLIYSLIFIPAFIMMSFYPQLVNSIKKDLVRGKKLYQQSLVFIAAAGFIIMALVFWLAEPIINLSYGASFAPSIPALKILTVAVFISFLAHVWLFTLTALGKQKTYTWAVGTGMVINIILNWIFIPKYSLYAAAWTTVITELITGLIIFLACQKYLFKNS